jgi:lipopolysaccharide transport system permease protein
MLYGRSPDFVSLGWTSLGSLVLLALAFMMFRKAAPEMVDVL